MNIQHTIPLSSSTSSTPIPSASLTNRNTARSNLTATTTSDNTSENQPHQGDPSLITLPPFHTLSPTSHPSQLLTGTSSSNQVEPPVTRSGSRLHLLAPLSNRLNAAQPVPSIRIPANPYAPSSSSRPAFTHTSSYTSTSSNQPNQHLRSATTPNGQYLYPQASPFLPPSHASSPLTSSTPYFYDTYDERLVRSPHPPLTAALRPDYNNSLWPPPLPTLLAPPQAGQGHSDPRFSQQQYHYARSTSSHSAGGQTYLSSPLTDIPGYSSAANLPTLPSLSSVPGPSGPSSSYRISPNGTYLVNGTPVYASSNYPRPPTTSSSTTSAPRASPVIIPPPLRFNYSQSPPPSLQQQAYNMPPKRAKANNGAAVAPSHVSSTPATVSSTSSRRRGAPAKQGWTVEQTVDSSGHHKEVLVIDDSESPAHAAMPPKKRTRAQVAAEAARYESASKGANGVNGHLTASSAGSTKRRKVDEASDAGSIKKAKTKQSTTATSNFAGHTAPAKPPPAPAATGANSWDDPEGHYIVKPDEFIGGKYKIIRLLGQGTFGKVVEARNIETRKKVAIKVIRSVQKYREASKIEVRVLETLKKHDPHNLNKCIHLEEYMDYRNHPCLVSELYGMSVFDFLKQNGFEAFPPRHIQDFAKSLLKSVDFLHRLKLVHTDLKPENILLVSNNSVLEGQRARNAKKRHILRNTDIRLIDFGSATFESDYHSSVVSTRHYRAPEIILGIPWSYPCDLFSIGCILVEFFTGDALFQTHDNLEHLAMMEVVMGRMPSRVVEKGRQKKPEYFKGNKIDFPNASVSRSSRKFVKGLKALHEIIPPNSTFNKHFLDLVTRLLDFDPDSRITVSQALRHPFCHLDVAEPVI